MFFSRKKRMVEITHKDEVIHDIHKITEKKIEEATKTTEKLQKLLEEDRIIAIKVLRATGGKRL